MPSFGPFELEGEDYERTTMHQNRDDSGANEWNEDKGRIFKPFSDWGTHFDGPKENLKPAPNLS